MIVTAVLVLLLLVRTRRDKAEWVELKKGGQCD